MPGDEIIGFVTRGRGVSVHRSDCANSAEPGGGGDRAGSSRSSGTGTGPAASTAAIEIKALDRTRLGVDVWRVLSDLHLNVLRSETLTGADRVSRMRFEFELADPAHLESLLASLKRIDSVYDAYRVLPGKGG